MNLALSLPSFLTRLFISGSERSTGSSRGAPSPGGMPTGQVVAASMGAYTPTREDVRMLCQEEEALMPSAKFSPGQAVAIVNECFALHYMGNWEILDRDYFPVGKAVTGVVADAIRDSGLVEEIVGPHTSNRTMLNCTAPTREGWFTAARAVLSSKRSSHGVPSLSYWSYRLNMAAPDDCPIRYRMCEAFMQPVGAPGVSLPAIYSDYHGSGFNAS